MDKKTAQKLIEVTFNSPFKEAQFTVFVKNLLNEFEDKHNHYSGNLIWDDYKDHINSYKRIGKYIDPEDQALDILIVEVKSVAKLERARTPLRNFVIKHLNRFEKDYALVAFYSKEDGGADWRFSFIKLEYHSELDETKGKVTNKKEFTPAKRYSFLVGEHEKSHTAKNQLLPLVQNIANNPTIGELESAFSIEKVTDEFFNQYKDLYVKFYELFEIDNQIKTELANAGIDNARFTKKLLGQIVFLYFLQKKGWLGVTQNERWGTGKKRFIQELYEEAKNEGLNFFKDKLQYLFYEALAKQRDNENSYYKRFDCRIPFLNGGLFEANYDWKEANITIPENLFRNLEKNKSGDVGTGVLDVFDRYNFTIKEDEPLDKEVAVDPEMLGKVFENMLDITERKSKGAFYTPREIVHYMCQESLIQYLDNAPEVKLKKEDIDTFIREGHLALENDVRVAAKGETRTYQYQLPENIRHNANLLDQKLSDIKICDPAIGSGAFPVGLLHELVNAMLVLKPHLSYDYLTKKLKGFGFEHLESVSDSRYIYRLKRHIIQESIYGVDIDASAIDIARLRLWLSLVVDEDDLDPIETLPNLDYKIVCGSSLIGMPNDVFPNLKVLSKIEKLKPPFYDETNEVRKKELKLEINGKIRELLDTAEQFAGYKIDFDFKLCFSEVWHKKDGFDIVIGNPPYISTKGVSEELKKLLKKQYNFADDTYNHFYFKGIDLLKEGGVLTYITPKTFWTTQTKRNLRDLLLSKQINYIFDTANPFEAAMVDTCVVSVSKLEEQNNVVHFLDGSKDLYKPMNYEVKQSVYVNTQNSVIFKPTEENMRIFNQYGHKVKELYNQWWEKISTSKNIEKSKSELERYRKGLRAGDLTLLGLLTEGGVGMQTGDNGKYIAVRKSTKWAKNILESRPKKLAEAIKTKKIKIDKLNKYNSTVEFLKSMNEVEITELFDSLKKQYGSDLFGKGYIYRLVDDSEIADVDTLTNDEKENGIDKSKNYYVPYDKGDKEGNRWYLETPFAIAWHKENVGFLKTDPRARYQGYLFYFREGFCWSLINGTRSENDLKFRISSIGVNDVGGMTLSSILDKVPSNFIVCICNSNIVSRYTEAFVNFTVNFQVNDARLIPIIIPSKEQLKEFEILFNNAVNIKRAQSSNEISNKEAEHKLSEIQEKLDEKVAAMYKL